MISTPWPAWFSPVADALLHSAMSPSSLKCHRGARLHGNPSASDISTSTPQPMGEGGRKWEPWHSEILLCNSEGDVICCNLGDYACQDEHDDFWFNKRVKRSSTLRLVALNLMSMFIIRAWQMHFITALLLHPHTSKEIDWFKWARTCFVWVTVWKVTVLWLVRGKRTNDVTLCKVTFAEVVRQHWCDLLVSILWSSMEIGTHNI